MGQGLDLVGVISELTSWKAMPFLPFRASLGTFDKMYLV